MVYLLLPIEKAVPYFAKEKPASVKISNTYLVGFHLLFS